MLDTLTEPEVEGAAARGADLALGDLRPERFSDQEPGSSAAGAPVDSSWLLAIRPPVQEHGPAAETPPAEATSLVLDAPDPIEAMSRRPRDTTRALSFLALLVALALHAAVLAALLGAPAHEIGGGGENFDAISIEVVPASAIEARVASAERTDSAPPAQVSANEGSDAASAAMPEKSETRKDSAPPPDVPRPIVDARPEASAAQAVPSPVQQEAAIAPPEIVRDEPALEPSRAATAKTEPPPEPELPKTVVETRPVETKAPVVPPPRKLQMPQTTEPVEAPPVAPPPSPVPPAPAAAPGGSLPTAAASGQAPSHQPRAARAAASKGAVRKFGLAVQSALLSIDQAPVRKALAGRKGTVVLRFRLSPTGELDESRVLKSSGRADIDDAALRLIQRARFPAPPDGMSGTERTYDAPIRFR